ncbi:MAG: sugar phosphate isomerase/epimerase [Kiritimatiellae bacterium]|nr:sugar phosphate isomerase/epimerase [Kiritimatiellia bacterium]
MVTRRTFIEGMAAAGLAATVPAAEKGRILFGACRGFGEAKLLKELGYDFLENGVASTLMPDKDEEAWKKQLDLIKALPLPIRSCNGFLPGKFRLTGEKASFDQPLAYAEKACRRADEIGLATIVFGSGGARNAPKGFPKEKAVEQFTDFCKRLSARIADCKVTVVLEPLQPREANFLNFVWEGQKICEQVGSPRLCVLADIFHMMQGGESAESILKAGKLLRHCHIAEKGPRTAPGMSSDGKQFEPYFAALKQIGYTGGVSCECGWGKKNDLRKNLAKALKLMRTLAGQV